MKLDVNACQDFVQDIHAFVDDQLAGSELARVVEHASSCQGCQDYMDVLRHMSALHRLGTEDLDARIVDVVDPQGILKGVTRDLVDEKQGALARLFYELGKAYVLIANPTSGEDHHELVTASAPTDVRCTEAAARRALREVEKLADAGEHTRASSLFRRSRKLFGSERRSVAAGPLAKARRFLEEALAIEPSLDEARIYLALQCKIAGRLDRARLEFRKVYREGRTLQLRLMALHWLGRLHAFEGDYRRAVECDAQVVAEHQEGLGDLFPYLFTLALNCIKAGLVDESCQHFETLQRRFPTRVAQARAMLKKAIQLRAFLERNTSLRDDLRRRVPALFAA